MGTNNVTLDKEAKILLLKILNQGYITSEQKEVLTGKLNLPTLNVEVIDKREQVSNEYLHS
jgi:hypothetical protein